MRTNYKRITNILNKSYNDVSIDKARGQGVVLTFLGADDAEQDRVRIVLVDHNSYRSDIGIHIKLSNSLDHDLVDAVETAFKDNYPTIWVHQPRKPNEETRKLKIECVKGWLKKPRVELKHSLSKVFDFEGTLESMNEEQLQLLLSFISGIYQSASSESREHWGPKCHNLRDALESLGVPAIETINIADARGVK